MKERKEAEEEGGRRKEEGGRRKEEREGEPKWMKVREDEEPMLSLSQEDEEK
jgi:hypothetical protein